MIIADLFWGFVLIYFTINSVQFLFFSNLKLDEFLLFIHQRVGERLDKLYNNEKFMNGLLDVRNRFFSFKEFIFHFLEKYPYGYGRDTNENNKQVEDLKPVVKYHEKYLVEMRKMTNDFILTPEEELIKEQIYHKFFEDTLNEMYNRVEIIKKEINDINFETDLIKEYVTEIGDNKPKRSESKAGEMLILQEELEDLEIKLQNKNKLNEQAEQHANHSIIKKRLENMKYNFVMEHTPLGNVIMFYNQERETFCYYSDNNIPYRFLETVGRKYVLTFHCRPLYVDMEEELKEAEKKLKEKEKEKERAAGVNKKPDTQKKNVFAQFKTYNKDAGSGRVNVAPPPKNSIPNRNNIPNANSKNENDLVLLKEKANRYTYEGRLCNMQIIQRVDRKKVDKRYATTFAEFKKMKGRL